MREIRQFLGPPAGQIREGIRRLGDTPECRNIRREFRRLRTEAGTLFLEKVPEKEIVDKLQTKFAALAAHVLQLLSKEEATQVMEMPIDPTEIFPEE